VSLLLVVLTAAMAVPFICFESWLFTSYKVHMAEKEFGSVEILFGDVAKMKGIEVPFGTDGSAVIAKVKEIRSEIPTINMSRFNSDKQRIVSVIVKNTGRVSIRNAHITVWASRPFTARTQGFLKFSDQEYTYEMKVMRPYSDLTDLSEFSAELPIGPVVFVVSVEGDNLTSYTGLGKINFVD
jgi:hypothetical protein